uniref:NADH-quinone oxidoreductase subunit J n=1 Tax=Marinobacterium jannaschii TaxID=64970 RepID=UPI001B805FCA|nr:NADH-quinone oxidoreductase subunit J [Marinobacterium jannaschii]
MQSLFYLTAAIALFSALSVICSRHAVRALLWLVLTQLAVALLFFLLGAPFAAALEVLVYAGAILVLFIFVIMMLNLGRSTLEQERQWFPLSSLFMPTLLCGVLLVELLYALDYSSGQDSQYVAPKALGISLFGPYLLVVELCSMLLLSGLIGAWHLTRPYLHPRQGANGMLPAADLRAKVQKEPWL